MKEWNARQLIFVDESAANERTQDRKYGWGPIGKALIEERPAKRSERWSILPAYTVKGYITWDIVHGSYTAELFDEFIETHVLPLCNRFPEERSIIIIDNARIHKSPVLLDIID